VAERGSVGSFLSICTIVAAEKGWLAVAERGSVGSFLSICTIVAAGKGRLAVAERDSVGSFLSICTIVAAEKGWLAVAERGSVGSIPSICNAAVVNASEDLPSDLARSAIRDSWCSLESEAGGGVMSCVDTVSASARDAAV
jgi:threonine/homoserine efflux transporter RhtA